MKTIDLSRFEGKIIAALRISLGVIFFWFGALKVIGASPVREMIGATFPVFGGAYGGLVLGGAEVLIGLGLIFSIFPRIAVSAMALHLLGTFSVFFLAPARMFDPYFPLLTFEGEFVFKNLVLVIGGLVVLGYRGGDPKS